MDLQLDRSVFVSLLLVPDIWTCFSNFWNPSFHFEHLFIMRVKKAKLGNIPEQCQTHSRPSVKAKASCLFSNCLSSFWRWEKERRRVEVANMWYPSCHFPACLHGKHSKWSQTSFWNQKEPQNPSQHRNLSCFYQLHGCDIWDETYLLSLDWIISKVAAETIWPPNGWSPTSKIIQQMEEIFFKTKRIQAIRYRME